MSEEEMRELDREIAVRVMGWGIFESDGETWACASTFCKHGPTAVCQSGRYIQGHGDRLMFHKRTFGFFPPGWSPTHDWAAAGEVIERLSKLGISVQFESFVWDEPHRFRKCHLFKGDNAPSHVMTYDPDMRVALCRGALSMMTPSYPTTDVARHE